MSCLWFALTCLAAVTVANAELADFIKTQLSSNAIFKSPIALNEVYITKDITMTNMVGDGTVSYTNLGVAVVSQTATELVFTVTGDAISKFANYMIMDYQTKLKTEWASLSGRDQNRFKVKLDVSNCIASEAPVVAREMFDIEIRASDASRDNPGKDQYTINKFEHQISEEIQERIKQALKTVAGALNLKGSGFQGC